MRLGQGVTDFTLVDLAVSQISKEAGWVLPYTFFPVGHGGIQTKSMI